VSITDRVLDALKSAIQLEMRVSALATNVADLARDVREIDKRLVRVETVIEFGTRGTGPSAPPTPPAIADGRR
jgi:hypothetical protein